MAINKVVFGDKTLLDLTEDTVTPDSVYEGYTFHSADGTLRVGARSAEGVVRYDVEQLLTDIQKAQARANIGASEAEHASTHAVGGSDPITPGSIGAAAANHTHDYAASDHTHTPAQIGASAAVHGHAISDVTGLQTALDGKQPAGSYAPAEHAHSIADVTGLQLALDNKQAAGSYAAESHTHTPASIGAAASVSKITLSGGTVNLTIVDNTEYRFTSAVTSLTLTFPSGSFDCWMKFTTGNSITVTFPSGTKYVGGAPTFEASKTYEMSIKDSVVICAEVTTE